MKRKNDNLLIEIVEKIAFVLFVVSIYLAIRWSDFRVTPLYNFFEIKDAA